MFHGTNSESTYHAFTYATHACLCLLACTLYYLYRRAAPSADLISTRQSKLYKKKPTKRLLHSPTGWPSSPCRRRRSCAGGGAGGPPSPPRRVGGALHEVPERRLPEVLRGHDESPGLLPGVHREVPLGHAAALSRGRRRLLQQ